MKNPCVSTFIGICCLSYLLWIASREILIETPVAGDESWHIETVAKRDANKKALEPVEKATDSEPVKGKELLESDELKRKLREAEERFRSGLSPKKAKSESR